MPVRPDPTYSQDAIAGPQNQGLLNPAAPPEQDQSALDVLSAAARGNVGGALYDRVTTPDPDLPAAPPGWDPLDHVQGFEGYAKDLWDAQTPSQLEGRKLRIQRNQQDAEVLRKTGFWGKSGEMVFAGVDPSFLVSIAIPEVRIAKWALAAKTATAALHGAAAGAAYEGEMQALKEGRSASESLYGVGSTALMSGVLGHVLGRVPPSKMKPIYDAIEEEAALARSEAGAAAVARPTTLSEESIARGAASLSRGFANTPLLGTDLDRIMASGNVSAHTAVQELADVPQILGKNEAGIATPMSVEAAVAKHDAALADFIDHAAQQWTEYAKRVPKADRMSKRDFYESIAKASRRGDSIGVPEIDSSAQFLRKKIFDPLKERAQSLGLMVDPVQAAQKRALDRAVEDYSKAEGSQIYSDYSARTNASVSSGEFRRLVRSEIAERAKPAAERTAVSEAPAPVREFVDVLHASGEARNGLDAQLESKLSTIDEVKQRGIEKAENAAAAARAAYQESKARIGQSRPKPGEPEALREPAQPVTDSVESPPPEALESYSVSEGELTDEQLAQFKGLRSDVRADENLGGPGEGVPARAGVQNARGGRGEPLRVYRGAARDLVPEDFKPESLGFASEKPAAGLGVFFSKSKGQAAQHGNVSEHLLDIQNPKVFRAEDVPGFDSKEAATEFSRKLQAEGYDGIVIDASAVGGPVNYVAFAPEQVLKAPRAASRVAKPKAMTREQRTIESMKLRTARDAELRAARKAKENEQRLAEKAAAAARKEHAAEVRKIREAAQAARAKAVEKFKAGGAIDKKEFQKRAEKAARGEEDLEPEINRMAKLLQDRETGRLEKHVQPKTVNAERVAKPLGAESYFRRMYDREAIRANLADWHQTLFDHFSKAGDAIPAEVHAAVDDVTKQILHNDVGQANFATKVTVPAAGPLKERTLDVPDSLIEKFLINDPQRVAQAYVRDLAPQIEMAQKFGDVDMKGRLGEISDEYAVQREKLRASVKDPAKLNKQLEQLDAQEKETLEAVVRIRDRVLGRAGRISPDAGEGVRRAVAVSRNWRNLVASARLGGTAITGGIMDTAKIAAQYGFMPTITKLTQLVKSKAFRDLSKVQARRVGSAVEAALAKRVQVAYDGAVTEGWSQTLANSVYKYTGLNHITDFNRTLSATLFEDSVLKAAGRIAEGKELPAFERTRLASLGLGDAELARIAEQVAQHGGDADGIRVSGSADWTDKALADKYDAAILKESKIAVQQPGAADRVWWLDKETGKLIGQLKTFSLSSPARLLSGGLQMAGQGQYGKAARFFGYMMMGGYLTHVVRQIIAGKAPVTDPKTASFEAFSESGLGGVMPDLLSPVGRRLGIVGDSVRYSDRNVMSAYGGPALGAASDAYDFAFNRTQGGISASDLHKLRRMLPWNNVWFLRREINALEGETAEGLDLKGADHATVGERLLRTDALPNNRAQAVQ